MYGRHGCLIYVWETWMPHICMEDMNASYMHGRHVYHTYAWKTCMTHICMEGIQEARFFKKGLRTPTYKTYSKKKRKFLGTKEGP